RTGNGPLHGVARAGKGREAVVALPHVLRLPVPVVGLYRPGAIGVFLLDLQEAVLDAQVVLRMPAPEDDSDSLPARVRRVGISDDTTEVLVRRLSVKRHIGLYGELTAAQVTRGGTWGDRQVVAQRHRQPGYLLLHGSQLPWTKVGRGTLVVLLDVLLVGGHVTGVGIGQSNDDHTRDS